MTPQLKALFKKHKHAFEIEFKNIKVPTSSKISLVKTSSGLHPLGPRGGGGAVYLNFDMEMQTQSNWCWAATSNSVSHFYNAASTWTQCLIAQGAFPGSGCCVNPGPCNQSWYLDRALTITANFVSISGSMNFSSVQAQLNTGRVIGARQGWRGGGGHFMVIHGCREDSGVNYLNIDDPIYGKSDIAESVFNSQYQGSGTWTHSYITKP